MSCVFIFLGYYTKPQITVLAILGFATLFFMGLVLQFDGVEQRVGSVDTYSYMCIDCVGNSIPDLVGNYSVVATVTTAFDYDVISDSTSKWIGRWLSIVSALGVALVFTSNKQDEDDD